MSEDKDKDQKDEDFFTKDELALAQASAQFLVKAVIDEKIGVQVFRDIKTKLPVVVIGKQVTKRGATHTMVSFTPLARLFTQNPHLEVEPIESSAVTTEHAMLVEMDQDGKVISMNSLDGDDDDEKIFAEHEAKTAKAKQTLN